MSPEKNDSRPITSVQPKSQDVAKPSFKRSVSEEVLPISARTHVGDYKYSTQSEVQDRASETPSPQWLGFSMPAERSNSPPPISTNEAVNRAISLSKKLSGSNIRTHITDSGDLMLDMTGYKSSEDEAIRAEVIARKILAEELEGNYDIGALIGADEHGNLWIYSSEEAKEAAGRKIGFQSLSQGAILSDAASDPGFHSDDEQVFPRPQITAKLQRTQSDMPSNGLATPPQTPVADIPSRGDPNRNYAKTLRLTSDQLKALNLKPGANVMSFSVNRATCQACLYYWTHDVPIVISDIDGTITK